MPQLDVKKMRHDLAGLNAALATVKSLLADEPIEALVLELVALAEGKSRTLLSEVDHVLDGDAVKEA